MAGRYIPPGWLSLSAAVDRTVAALDPAVAWSGGLEAQAWLAREAGERPEAARRWLAGWKVLRDALAAGTLRSLVIPADGSDPVTPDAVSWAAGRHDNPWAGEGERPADRCLVAEDDLKTLLAGLTTAKAHGPADQTLLGTSARGQCKALIRALAADGQAPESKNALFAIASARISGLSRRAFDAAWDAEAPADWRRPGRRG
jgi:hypothetical protein